jgi:Flp pilus assembly protein TadB
MARHPADGTVGHPYSALNLRLVLALFGLAAFLALAAVAWWGLHLGGIAAICAAVALVALINVLVVERRRAQRRRREPDADHSLFE